MGRRRTGLKHDDTGPQCAWWRAGPSEPWQPVCRARDWRSCFLVLAARLACGGEGMVVPVGTHPDQSRGQSEGWAFHPGRGGYDAR